MNEIQAKKEEIFKPKLSAGTIEMMTQRNKTSPSFEDLYKEAKMKAKKK